MATGESVGMMEGAFFVSRKDVLDWLNNFLHINLTKVEQTHDGAVAVQIWDAMFPEAKIKMSKVKWDAKQHYEKVSNYKILQSGFDKVGVKKHIPVDSLLRGKYQDNLEFMQWLNHMFKHNYDPVRNYNAEARRKLGQGGSKYRPGGASKGGAQLMKRRSKPTCAHSTSGKTASTVSKETGGPTKQRTSTKAKMGTKTSSAKENMKRGSGNVRTKKRVTGQSTTSATTNSTGMSRRMKTHGTNGSGSGASLAEVKKLRAANEEMEIQMKALEAERNFYFGKLRDIEILLQNTDLEGKPTKIQDDGLAARLSKNLFKILYATEDEDIDVAALEQDVILTEKTNTTSHSDEQKTSTVPLSSTDDKDTDSGNKAIDNGDNNVLSDVQGVLGEVKRDGGSLEDNNLGATCDSELLTMTDDMLLEGKTSSENAIEG